MFLMSGCQMSFYLKMVDPLFNFSPKTEPLRHQIEAIEFMKGKRNIPLFDEQGLGKSKIVIDTLCNDLKENIIDSALIVCKKTLLHTWEKEISKHSYLQSTILLGTKRQRGRSFMHFNHFYLVNYESLISELGRIKMFLGLRKFAIILDESQKIKNPNSKISRSVLQLRDLAVKRIIITGTPVANRPEDLWAQFYFLDSGKTLGDNFTEFKNKFKVDLKGEQNLGRFECTLSLLRKKIENVSIRRTKDVLELPGKVYKDEYIELSGIQKDMYDKAKNELFLEIQSIDGKIIQEKIENYLVKLLRLTQIASNPALIDSSYKEISTKILKLDGILKSIIEKNEKVIVWTSFRKNIRCLRRRYGGYGALMLFGEMLIDERDKVVEKFLNRPENKVLIANPSVAKEGLTLTSANNVVYLDRSFKLDDYLQSQDRIHRIGQEKKCNIIKLIAKNTIDEYTDEILEKKHLIAQYTLGDIRSIDIDREFLTKEDLLRILG